MSDSDNNFEIYVSSYEKQSPEDLSSEEFKLSYHSPSPLQLNNSNVSSINLYLDKESIESVESVESNDSNSNTKKNNICLGKFVKNLSNVILYYTTIDKILKSHGSKLQELIKKIKKSGEFSRNKLDQSFRNSYMAIIYNLRKDYLKFIESGLIKIDDGWIDGTEHRIKINKVVVNIIPFLPIYYLTEANQNKETLYFKKSPKSTSYRSNKIILFKDVKPGRTLYPVWLYKVKNQLDSNYSTMLKQIKDNHNGYELYTNLLDYRATLNKSMVVGNRNTVDALGKYKFLYNTSKSYLYDPKNSKILISPRKQGVIDGYYSFAESIDTYKSAKEGIRAIQNTLIIIEKMRHSLGLYVGELVDKKKLILK